LQALARLQRSFYTSVNYRRDDEERTADYAQTGAGVSKLSASYQSFTINGSKPFPVAGCGVGLGVEVGVAVCGGLRADEDEWPHPPATMQTSISSANNSCIM
jgi:hypothetical protein